MHRHRPVAHVTYRVDHERQAGKVIQVRMGDEDVIDLGQFGDCQVADPGSGIDQNIIINQERRSPQMTPANSAATSEDSYLHRFAACAVPPQAGSNPTTGSRASN